MNVTPTRMGWCRWSSGGAEGAARLVERHGRATVVELVAAGRLTDRPLDAAAEVNLWAAGSGAEAVAEMMVERLTAAAHVVARVDAAERSEPARRAAWGIGGAAEAGQQAMLALVVAVPEDRFKPDVFYAEVAVAYGTATEMFGRGGARGALARANGVSVSKVYAWLKEARRRGLMEPAPAGAA